MSSPLCHPQMPFGRTALHLACRDPEGDISTLLPSPSLNVQDDHGFTPLYHACNFGNAKAVKELLEQAEIEPLPDKGGLTPFHIACYSPNSTPEIVTMILSKFSGIEHVKDTIGRTGKDWAREKGNTQVFKMLSEGSTGT